MQTANRFHIKFHEQNNFSIRLRHSTELTASFGEVQIVSDKYPEYEGPYEVTPKIQEQVLETRNTSMLDDVTVLEIPYEEVTNLGGGLTAVIGFEN